MNRKEYDILVSGGGIAGMCAAISFANAGFSVVCAEPNKPITNANDPKADFRSTAFLQPAKTTLENAKLWDQLAPYATPLQIMRLADAGGAENEIRHVADFNANEISDNPFAWNLPNWLLRREMTARLDALPNATFLTGQKTTRITTRSDHALAQVGDRQIKCQLIIAADGRNSSVRQALGIPVKTWRYGQKALSFAVRHEHPHQNISTEIHRTGGPFTTVPLPSRDGKHYSAVIWMETSAKANALLELPEPDFNTQLNNRSCGILGQLTLTSPRNIWPIISQMAESLIAQRTALIAEAAHVVPPIGAQGLNMSLGDIESLLSNVTDTGLKLGSAEHLNAYQKERISTLRTRVRGVDALNRAAMTQGANLRDLRLKGLQALHGFTPIRTRIMKHGLG